MGIVAALLVFLYPLGMPFVTLGSFIVLSILCDGRVGAIAWRGALLVPVLVLALGPGVIRNGSGAFALPWWLVVGPSGGEHYVWHYAFVCTVLLAVALLVAFCYQLLKGKQKAWGSRAC